MDRCKNIKVSKFRSQQKMMLGTNLGAECRKNYFWERKYLLKVFTVPFSNDFTPPPPKNGFLYFLTPEKTNTHL